MQIDKDKPHPSLSSFGGGAEVRGGGGLLPKTAK